MKRFFCVIPLVCLLCFAFGCQDKAAMAELETFKTQAKLEEQNKEVIKRYGEEEDKGNLLEVIDEIVAPDVVYHYPNNEDIKGLETIRQHYVQFHEAFPDVSHTGEFQIAEGDLVASRVAWRGTHKGTWFGIEPTGRETTFTLIEVCRLKDGKIVEAWIEFDYLGWFQQLGMELKPRGAEK